MGRNKDKEESSSDHVARPLTDLKDPASFAPPPKRTGSGLAPAPKPASVKRKVITAPSKYADPRAGPVEPPARNTGSGVEPIEGAPAASKQIEDGPRQPKAYQANTTGLSTDNFARPPGRRDGADGRSPPSYNEATGGAAPKALPPSLPPRLPPRGAAGGGEQTGGLNEGAVNRLGAAGVSVPALGIGHGGTANSASPSPPPPPAARASPSPSPGAGKWGAQVNELQGRFAKLGTSSTGSSAQEQPPAPSGGTTWAQKQAALKTASNFQKDPSSVSFSDAKSAASTANNFRQRHGEQVAAGARAANNLNQKYGVMDKVGAYTGSQNTEQAQKKSSPPPLPGPGQPYTGVLATEAAPAAVPGLAGKKKPPPPPPKKKPGLAAANPPGSQGDGPPPVPMSTRPQF